MASLAVKLPITKNTADGFEMIKDFQTLIKQNFKMLLLTHPGERVMEPSFGVGVQKYLFENFSQKTFSDIEAKIIEQVQIYMPVITIREVNFAEDIANTNKLYINIQYSIPTLNVQDLIEFTI
jgi:phage baseplate assembly protein W